MSESAYLTRAREWMIENWLWENRQEATERLASLLTQVRNETLEEALNVCAASGWVNTESGNSAICDVMDGIRSLKSPG